MGNSNWSQAEFQSVNLGDKRLNERLTIVSESFANSPMSSINKCSEDWAETKGAYRFFANEKINYLDILDAHTKKTVERCDNEDIVLAIQDTTYFSYKSHPKTKGLGCLSKHKGKHKGNIETLGTISHTTLALSTNGLPLGLLDQKNYAREELSEEMISIKKRSHNIALPIEKKESFRWLESFKKTNDLFKQSEKTVVTIADREADIYDLYLLAKESKENAKFLIRANHNRMINKKSTHSEGSGETIIDFLEKIEACGEINVEVPCRNKEPKRIAECTIKFSSFKLQPPKGFKGAKQDRNSPLTLNVINVKEKKTDSNYPLDWTLLTNIEIVSFQDALSKIRWYTLRWRVEEYFKIIKSGFIVEDCRLNTANRLIRYLTVMSIVAWRVFWLTHIARTSPESSALIYCNEFECKILTAKFSKKMKVRKSPPSIKEMVYWIAQLGGFLNRKSDGEPGITHVWRGIKEFHSIIQGAEIARSIYG